MSVLSCHIIKAVRFLDFGLGCFSYVCERGTRVNASLHFWSFKVDTIVNFPTNNLNFHWRWRWWDWIQAILLNLFYFILNTKVVHCLHLKTKIVFLFFLFIDLRISFFADMNATKSTKDEEDVLLVYSRHCPGAVEWAKYLHKLYTELSKHKGKLR